MYCIERSVNVSITKITTIKLWLLAIAMISLHMPIFMLMVAMVAEFHSLIILIHNTLLREILISSKRTTRVNEKHHTSISLVGKDVLTIQLY